MKKSTIEKQTAAVILEEPLGTINIDGTDYIIEPLTTGTLIMLSSLISELPEIDTKAKSSQFVAAVLKAAGESEALGQIAATIVLGAKRIKQHPFIYVDHYRNVPKWSWTKFRRVIATERIKRQVYERDYLAERILDTMTPKALNELISKALAEGNLADFFVLTTSLNTKNLTKPTREVVKPTAFGHS